MTSGPIDQAAALEWDEAGAPRSARFGDIYFSRQDGLEESRTVFLQGCGLPEAWRGRRQFTVGELGFGTGLNIAALIDLWRRERTPRGHLQIFSVEAYPLSRDDAARALSAWPELADTVRPMLDAWPAQARGFRRVDFPEWNVTLDLAVMEAAEALAQWGGRADAWFLDGFSPSANPQMWRDEVLALVAARSAPDVRLATFTVAGAVRRGLQAQGLQVEKKPGHGRKRQRLEARAAGPAAPEPPLPTIAIVGAGVAGAALARSLTAAGGAPLVIACEEQLPAASGNPAALVSPRLDAGGGEVAALSAQAFSFAVNLYRRTSSAVIAQGAVQLEAAARDPTRFDTLAASPDYRDCRLERVDRAEASRRLGEASGSGGLWLACALTLDPAAVLAGWTLGLPRVEARAAALHRTATGWQVLDAAGAIITEADCIVLAAGVGIAQFTELDLQPVRGQVSYAVTSEAVEPAAWGGYAVPWRNGVLFGATHDRDQTCADVRAEDHARNLAELASRRPRLAAALSGLPLRGRAGVRASTPDRLPVAGAAPGQPGVFVLGGLGGRGFTFAPLLAEHVAALICGLPSPLPLSAQALVEPDRFRQRQQRRAAQR